MTKQIPNFGYIFVEDRKQYFSVQERPYFQKQTNYSFNKVRYISKDDSSVSILGDTFGSFDSFKTWIMISPLSEEDKIEMISLFEDYKDKSFLAPSFNVAKNLIDINTLPSGATAFEAYAKQNLSDMLDYQQKLKTLNKTLKKYKINPEQTAFTFNYFDKAGFEWQLQMANRNREVPPKEKDFHKVQAMSLSSILPPDSASASVLKHIQFTADNAQNIYTAFKSLLENKVQTEGLYVVYSTRMRKGPDNKEVLDGGFVNKNQYTGPLKEAEIFYDVKRAERACKARGITSYQVWDVSMTFNKPVFTNDKFVSTEALNTIVARQEKEFFDKAMEMQEIISLKNKLTQYEEILKTNNLLPEKVEVRAASKQKNKI